MQACSCAAAACPAQVATAAMSSSSSPVAVLPPESLNYWLQRRPAHDTCVVPLDAVIALPYLTKLHVIVQQHNHSKMCACNLQTI